MRTASGRRRWRRMSGLGRWKFLRLSRRGRRAKFRDIMMTDPATPAVETKPAAGPVYEVLPDVACVPTWIVKSYIVRTRDNWLLVDAGLHFSAHKFLRAIKTWFGADVAPKAIVLTHGHFDHIGALRTLADRWDVPVYAHALERPYLDGSRSYPPPDPSVGGGLLARLSPLFPTAPID